MAKKMFSCFLSLSLILLIFCCKKQLPTTPDIPELLSPTIEYFYASPTAITIGQASTLAWSTTNATSVFINMLTGELPATGTLKVYPDETTTYVLAAKNDAGVKLKSCTVEIEKRATFTVGTIPTNPLFYYVSSNNTCYADFAVAVHETSGVGGQIEYIHIYGWENDWRTCGLKHVPGGMFSPYGSFTTSTLWVLFTCRVAKFEIVVNGVDENGYEFDERFWFGITWAQNRGTVTFLRSGASRIID